MHVDMDAFYASVEVRDDPSLRGRPVVVGALPGGRGVVATCSYEARRFGIRSAMPVAEAVRRCPHAVFLRPRMAVYREVSRQVRGVLDGLLPVVESVSIDEAYADASGLGRLLGPPEAIARRVKQDIRSAVGLTASVGMGPNRLVAKLASDFGKPDGLAVVRPEQVLDFLAPMPVGNLRGVGPRMGALLAGLGLTTVERLRAVPLEALQAQLGGRAALSLWQQARGIAPDRVGRTAPRKSMSREITFPADVSDVLVLEETLARLVDEVACIASREGVGGGVLTLKIRFRGFETHTRQRRLVARTDDAGVLVVAARALLRQGGQPGRPVRLVGVGLSDLGPVAPVQGDLFAAAEDVRGRRIAQTLEQINARFGPGALRRGVRHPPA